MKPSSSRAIHQMAVSAGKPTGSRWILASQNNSAGPGMAGDAVGDRFDPRLIAEIDRHAARLLKRFAIELEPARLPGTGQHPVGNDDVGVGAGTGELGPVDAVAATDCE